MGGSFGVLAGGELDPLEQRGVRGQSSRCSVRSWGVCRPRPTGWHWGLTRVMTLAGERTFDGAQRAHSARPLGASFTARRGEGTNPLLHLAGHHVEPERPATSALSGNAGVAGVSGEALKVPGTRVGGGGGCAWGIDQRCRGESTSNRPILLVVSGIDQWSIRALFPQVRPGLVDSASQVSLARVRARLRGVRLCDRPTGRNRPAL